jgi:hypothetical protein
VKIGLGGEANWDGHIKSAAHIQLERSTMQKATASRFFSKFLPGARSAHIDTALSSTSNILSTVSGILDDAGTSERSTSPNLEPLSIIETASAPPSSPSPTSESFNIQHVFAPSKELECLLTHLRIISKALPFSIPEGVRDDQLAALSGDFSLEVATIDPDMLWEYINKATDRVFGYGMGVQELSALIRRGQYGMDGVCTWLKHVVVKLGGEAIMLEGCIGWLIEAMEFLYISPSWRDSIVDTLLHVWQRQSVNS